jgi:hypothetical protein
MHSRKPAARLQAAIGGSRLVLLRASAPSSHGIGLEALLVHSNWNG